jgi:hypothetical protein
LHIFLPHPVEATNFKHTLSKCTPCTGLLLWSNLLSDCKIKYHLILQFEKVTKHGKTMCYLLTCRTAGTCYRFFIICFSTAPQKVTSLLSRWLYGHNEMHSNICIGYPVTSSLAFTVVHFRSLLVWGMTPCQWVICAWSIWDSVVVSISKVKCPMKKRPFFWTCFNYQLNAQFLYSIIIYYVIILDMLRAILCSSSGGQTVLLQHLVSSLWK